MLRKMGIKKSWLAGKLAIGESLLRYHLQQGLSEEQNQMIVRVLEHSYKHYFGAFKDGVHKGRNSKH